MAFCGRLGMVNLSTFAGITEGKEDMAMVVWERAQALSKDFRIFNFAAPPVIPLTPVCKGWTIPPAGVIKINVDAAVVDGKSGYGAISRDHDGFVVGGSYSFTDKIQDVKWAKFDAFVEGLNLALKLKVDKLILESDSASLVNAVNKRDQDITILGCYVNKACKKLNEFNLVQAIKDKC
ncbi:uncharacterized protein LOC108450896 [Gossypium arboreum]|uniref:uncharacterized protein LOC108450896 n=1 Tax=Gossypium arboreum TaxID=29729 RepID=UPI0022F15B15|nr:uncharacterized protein LOC108450896 [Gossypium arboreum]